ncbi:MAG: hypothetical protein KOO66_04415 [Bacteroidales bacterium]|nr:hypothetical protein [Bacteroidales bacterium]
MKYFAVLITILFFSNSILPAQETTSSNLIDKDKKNYEENVFNQEFDEYQDTTNAKRNLYDRIPEKLPDWVFNPVDFSNPARVVAYSDPNMEKDEAFKQAILRAKAIFALMNYSTISNITDDYTNLHESGKYSLYSTKFQDFSLSKATIPYDNSGITLVDTFYTKYNEGIVLIKFNYDSDSEKNVDTLEVKGEHLQVFMEKNFRHEKIEFFNFFIKDNIANSDSADLISQYNYRVVNREYDISSIYGEKLIIFEGRTYNYRTDLEFARDSTDSELNTFRLTRGLWNGYVSGILSNITVLSKQLASQVKNTNDFYTLKNEGLIRTVARNKVSFDFNDFKMYENQFCVDLNGQIRF